MKELLKLAREAIIAKFEGREIKVEEKLKKKYSAKKACFVTLTISGELRGCIGSLEARQELWKDVVENARSAAFSDPRFNSLTRGEFDKIKIEISILSVPEKIAYNNIEELKRKIKGRGLIIEKEGYSATYLPQVWEQIEDEEDFLSSLCEKAGLSALSWKNLDLEVWTYSIKSIEE